MKRIYRYIFNQRLETLLDDRRSNLMVLKMVEVIGSVELKKSVEGTERIVRSECHLWFFLLHTQDNVDDFHQL